MQHQTLPHIVLPNARLLPLRKNDEGFGILGHRILRHKAERVARLLHLDMHIAIGMRLQTAVFEAVLDDRLQQHGRNHEILLFHLLLQHHIALPRHTHHLEVDEVLDILDFLAQISLLNGITSA